MRSAGRRAARKARQSAQRLERRIDHEAAQLAAVRVQHLSGAHLVRPDGDVTLCGRSTAGKTLTPADTRWDAPCMRCADAAKTLLA